VRRLGRALARAGVPLSAGHAALLVVVGGVVLSAAVHALAGYVAAAALAAAAPAAGLAVRIRSGLRGRPARIAAQLPALARRLADGLRAGLSLRQSLARATPDLPEPIRDEIAQVSADLAHGTRAEDALDALAARLPHPDVEITVCAVLVTLRTGGDLARILSDLADGLEERARTAAELATATAQARMTAWLVAALPLVAGVAVELFAPGTLGRTLGEGAGRAAAVVSALLFVTALVLVRRLSRVTA